MSQYPQYVLPNDNNQYNIVGFDVNNVFKNMMENPVDLIAQNFTSQNNTYFPPNKITTNPYLLQVGQNYMPMQPQFMPVMSFPNGNFVYLNQQPQFLSNTNNNLGSQYNSQMLPMQLSPTVMSMKNPLEFNHTINEQINKPALKVRKKSYNKSSIKTEAVGGNSNSGGGGGLIEDIPCDTKNRPLLFNCSACSKRFSTQARLDQHFLCHTGDRPYVCNICNFAFTQKSYLMRHTAVHKEERSFECALCKKTYKHYGSLANHRKTHNKSTRKISNDIQSTSSIIDTNVANHLDHSSIKVEPDIHNINAINSSFSNQNLDENYIFHNALHNNPSQQQQQQQQQQNIIKSEIKQENVQHQLYENHYNTDLSATTDLFSNSFPYHVVSSNLSTNSASSCGFLDHLNFSNVHFANSDSNVNGHHHYQHKELNSDNNNINSLISSLDSSSQPAVCLSQSIDKEDDDILTFAV